MDITTFTELLWRIEPSIKKKDTVMRKSIPPKVRLQITLLYMASGTNYRTLESLLRVSHSTISGIVIQYCIVSLTVSGTIQLLGQIEMTHFRAISDCRF